MKTKKEKRNYFVFQKNNKGVSEVVATLLIVLLVLVTASIVWVVVRGAINSGTSDINVNELKLYLSVNDAYITNESGQNVTKVVVSRDVSEGDLTGVRFIFSDSLDSYSVDRKTPITPAGRKTFTFNASEIGVVSVNSLAEVSIAPIYLVSGKEKFGQVTDTAQIKGK